MIGYDADILVSICSKKCSCLFMPEYFICPLGGKQKFTFLLVFIQQVSKELF